MNDSNFLKEIGRSYIVSAYLPAAVFVLLAYFLFRGFIPNVLIAQAADTSLFKYYQWIVVFLATLWVAFYLFSSDDTTVRLFEGYYIRGFLRKKLIESKRAQWEKEYQKYKDAQDYRAKILAKMENHQDIDSAEMEYLARSRSEAMALLANLSIRMPPDPKYMMPTRLGNVLRASEMYAYERYSIAEITIWPRLAPFLPPQMTRNIEEKNNRFLFLINSAYLAILNGVLCLGMGILGVVLGLASNYAPHLIAWAKGFFYMGFDALPYWAYLGISPVLIGFGYMLYGIAINVAEDYSMYVRMSFDLYRTDLLRQMRWIPPKTLEEEKRLWDNISRFFIDVNRLKVELPTFADAQPKEGSQAGQIRFLGVIPRRNKRYKSRST